jgi:glucan-binding YG repeat protein
MLVFEKEEYLPTGLKDEIVYIKEGKKLFYIINDNNKLGLMTDETEIDIEIPPVIDDIKVSKHTTYSSSTLYRLLQQLENQIINVKKQNEEPQKVEKIIEKEKPQNIIRSIINDKTINRLIRLNNKEKLETSIGNYFINGYIMSKKRFDIKLINSTKKGFEKEIQLNGQWLNDRSKWVYLINDTIEIGGSQKERYLMIKDDNNIISCNAIAFMI